MYEISYPAPGRPELAKQVTQLLGRERASVDTEWGLDHGTWSVLRWMYPEANIPVVQLSIDRGLDAKGHLTLARSLGALREEGALILGSGNVAHNLQDALGRVHRGTIVESPSWAQRFDKETKNALEQRDELRLLSMWPDTDDGKRSHPTPDHWWLCVRRNR